MVRQNKNSHICKGSLIHYYYQATISCPTDEQVQSLINNAFLVSGGSKKTVREPKEEGALELRNDSRTGKGESKRFGGEGKEKSVGRRNQAQTEEKS